MLTCGLLQLNDATFSQFTSTNVCAPYEDGQRCACLLARSCLTSSVWQAPKRLTAPCYMLLLHSIVGAQAQTAGQTTVVAAASLAHATMKSLASTPLTPHPEIAHKLSHHCRSHPSAADKAGTSKPAKGAAGKVETPFKPSSPMKKSSAPQAGDLYGTLSKPEHVLVSL